MTRKSGVSKHLTDWSSPRLFGRVVLALGLGCIAFFGAVGPAYSNTFGGFIGGPAAGVGDGPGGRFIQPRDVALYEGSDDSSATDKIFVADTGVATNSNTGARIQRLDADGNFDLLWGRDVLAGGGSGAGEICSVAASCQMLAPAIGVGKGEFNKPSGIAVDQSDGSVYVHDRTNFRIQKFDLGGNFILMFGFDVNQTLVGTGFEVCTQASGDVCKVGVAGNGSGQFGNIAFNSSVNPKLAVDPISHDVFVADPANTRIQRFTSSGSFVSAFGSAGSGLGQFAASSPQHIAVDAAGVVYASDTNSNRINRYDTASSTFLAPIGVPPLLSAPTSGLEVEPDSDGAGPDVDRLYVVRDPAAGATVVEQIDSPGTVVPPAAIAASHTFADQPVNGSPAISSTTGVIYLPVAFGAASFPACGACHGLALLSPTGGAPAAASVTAIDDIQAHEATLVGTVNPGGTATYRFEYSKNGVDWITAGSDRYVSGTGPIEVSRTVSGLEAGTSYRVRLITSKYTSLTNLAVTTSAEDSFETDDIAPDVMTLPPSTRRAASAILQARINPNGSSASYHFQYGETTSYGRVAPTPDASAGDGGVDRIVSQLVDDLDPATTYHYRVVAENASGVSIGADVTFTTRANADALEGRGYELVTPRHKASGPGVGGHGGNSALDGDANVTTGVPSFSGDRVVANTIGGPVFTNDGASVYVHDYVLSERESDGWRNEPAFNLPNYGNPQIPFRDIVAADEELSLMAWRGAGDSRLFPEETGTSGQLRDWAGHWRSLASVSGTPAFATSATSVAPAVDGSAVAYSGLLGGQALLGAGDASGDQLSSSGSETAYLVELEDGITGTWDDRGPTALLGSCLPGAQLPERLVSGKLDTQDCPPPTEYSPGQFRSEGLISTRGSSITSTSLGDGSMRNVVSAGGDRAFFMSPDPTASDPDAVAGPLTSGSSLCGPGTGTSTSCPAQLYIRQRDATGDVAVRWISQPQVPGQDAALLGPAYFEGASRDGDKILFGTASPLTADDPNAIGAPTAGGVTTGSASSNSWDLYMYDLPNGLDGDPATPDADPAGGSLTRISAGPLGTGDCNTTAGAAPGALRFVSDDGSRVYFTCAAPLPGVPAPGDGTVADPGGTQTTTDTVNLYLYDANRPAVSDRWTFVARLPRATSAGDVNTCASTGTIGGESRTTAFSMVWSYTLIEQARTCVHGTPDGRFLTFWTRGRLVVNDPDTSSADLYAFDADADELIRVSAPQGGVGGTYTCVTIGNVQCHGDPGFLSGTGDTFRRSQLGVADTPVGKAAYFQSRSRLRSSDPDGDMDVYQWGGGDLSLLSSGTTSNGAYYSGNSGSGQDVFLVTADRLSWEDVDGVRDVYDARVGGGFDQPVPAVLCNVLADDCQGPGAVPPGGTSEQTTGSGEGNLASDSRGRLVLSRLSAKARRRAAVTGVLPVKVLATVPGVVRAVARARLGGRGAQVVGSARRRFTKAGTGTLRLRLSFVARRHLRAGRRLRTAIRVTQAGARPRSSTATLQRRTGK
jgi:hypothetical protein